MSIDPARQDDPPFAGLQRALESGKLSVARHEGPRIRRYDPHYCPTSKVPREERIRLCMPLREPKFRRTEPRC
jgi:hypothetical protein